MAAAGRYLLSGRGGCDGDRRHPGVLAMGGEIVKRTIRGAYKDRGGVFRCAACGYSLDAVGGMLMLEKQKDRLKTETEYECAHCAKIIVVTETRTIDEVK